jgi:hypothetical protein
MIKFLPYHAGHLDLLNAKPEDLERYGIINSGMKNALADNGISFTVVADGRVLLVGGIMLYTEKTGYGWTIVGQYAKDYGIGIFRAVKKHLESMMDDLQLHRIETSNLKDATDHHKWCRLLGFVEEGPLSCYDDLGRDYIRFAKTRGAKWAGQQ